jgi:Ca2+-binding EF-hand superfamily protein
MDMVPEIDEELAFYDENNDGHINYSEFMRNHKRRLDQKKL